MIAAGIESGDLVITTPFSFVASANCILYEGGIPVFVDLVQYEAKMDQEWWPVVRYDMAHGYLHRDTMSPDRAVVAKDKIPYTHLSEALTDALDELHRQWPFYRRRFEEWMT